VQPRFEFCQTSQMPRKMMKQQAGKYQLANL